MEPDFRRSLVSIAVVGLYPLGMFYRGWPTSCVGNGQTQLLGRPRKQWKFMSN